MNEHKGESVKRCIKNQQVNSRLGNCQGSSSRLEVIRQLDTEDSTTGYQRRNRQQRLEAPREHAHPISSSHSLLSLTLSLSRSLTLSLSHSLTRFLNVSQTPSLFLSLTHTLTQRNWKRDRRETRQSRYEEGQSTAHHSRTKMQHNTCAKHTHLDYLAN